MKKIINSTPFFGYYKPNFEKFIDTDLFDPNHKNYIKLKKVKVWYGLSDTESFAKRDKALGNNILGIQSEYLDSITGEIKSTEMNCGKIKESNIITQVLDIASGDYINKFVICFNNIISYLKLETKDKKKLEVGKFNKNTTKTLEFNSENIKENYMILSFYGYFNELGLRSLGCNYVNRNEYVIYNLIDYFRFRYFLEKNDGEKDKWTEDAIKALNYDEKVFIRICLLPKSLFFKLISYV